MASDKTEMRKKKDIPQSLDVYSSFYGMELDEKQKVYRDSIWDPNIDVVFCNARAGTGKTTIAVGVANLLVQYGLYDGIVYIVSPTQEEKQGYLPGTQEQKSAPYMEPLYEALKTIGVNPDRVIQSEDNPESEKYGAYIQAATHTYMRGINFDNKVILTDETQNMYNSDLKKVLTRAKSNCKVICIGHAGQCDLYKHPENSGFEVYLEHFRGHDRTAICELTTNHRGWISQWADMLEF
jgi:phosphate starvation-inducible PhoH-like protein|uniref:PhoH-like protein n=1 Tax=Siphoviridae sp. ctGa111 TaxID=2825413 RepID=A0A8S5VDD1_9CAUD|nr:MAG TPA: PhoH-like protein [Bacteriophage sp.]DAG04686.1 MAG TPA: PhoH-like protein [Siphoviridae sp. ctGa111]DAI11992.1 MAG TPA: PhoH-like protein [Bacteriophage sp.]DAN17105.1 MAG TPA: PhoH-like protein [Caudoviricetes sp.]